MMDSNKAKLFNKEYLQAFAPKTADFLDYSIKISHIDFMRINKATFYLTVRHRRDLLNILMSVATNYRDLYRAMTWRIKICCLVEKMNARIARTYHCFLRFAPSWIFMNMALLVGLAICYHLDLFQLIPCCCYSQSLCYYSLLRVCVCDLQVVSCFLHLLT